jgi:ankyrin repeat protein
MVCEMASWVWAIEKTDLRSQYGEGTGIDAKGNLYVLTDDYGSNTHCDFLTVKYSKECKKLWERRFDGRIHGRDTSSAITVDGPGNVCVTGQVQLRENVNDGKAFGCATIKYDKDGKQLWAALYETSSGKSPSLNSIAVDNDGNVYLTGSDTVKYDEDGKELWAISDDGAAIKPGLFGDVYVVGNQSGRGTFTTRKYNSCGKLLWDATYSGEKPTYRFARALAVDDTGAVCVFGSSWHLDDKYSHLITIKYDSEGRQQWVARARYVEPGNKNLWPVGIVADDKKNVYITGYGTTPGRQEHGYDDNPLPLMIEFVTIKYDSRGKEQWVAKYKGAKRRRGHVNGLGIDRAGNVYVKGYVEHPQLRNEQVGIIIKYDKNGREKWVTYFEDISEAAKILLPSYSPPPDKVGAKWFETRRSAKKAALLSDIRESSDLNSKDKHGYSLLERAASGGYIDIIKMLIDKGAKVTDDAVCAGVWTGQAEAVKILAQAHGNITADSPCMFEALTWLEEPAVVKALLEAGLDASAKDKEGDSLLSWSFDGGHFDIVKLLLDAGADVNSRDSFGEPLVHEALRANDLDIVKAFINAGVRLDTKNTSGQTLLGMAVDENNTAIVKLLLDAGADVTGEKRGGALLLFEAIDQDNVGIVRLLIKAGVDPSVRDKDGWTALHRAIAYSSKNVLSFLLELDFDVNAKDAVGRTALQFAIEWDRPEIVGILRKYGAKE